MSTTDEVLQDGPVPLWEVPGWRERFGVVAGITGRGSGAVPFDLGLWGSQPVGEVMSRWRSFLSALPGAGSALLAHQVHGTNVLWHDEVGPGWTLREGADGHLTPLGSTYLLATVADCVPVYLVAPTHGVIGLLHAGWRGTAAGIVGVALAALRARTGVEPADVVMHCGVAISGARYQVGREVMEGVGAAAPGGGPWHLDLREVLAGQAEQAGVCEVTVSGYCSAGAGKSFFSHRASGGADGRMVAYVGRPGTGPV